MFRLFYSFLFIFIHSSVLICMEDDSGYPVNQYSFAKYFNRKLGDKEKKDKLPNAIRFILNQSKYITIKFGAIENCFKQDHDNLSKSSWNGIIKSIEKNNLQKDNLQFIISKLSKYKINIDERDIREIQSHQNHPYFMNTKWFIADYILKNVSTLSFIVFNIFAYINKFELISGKKLLFLDIATLLGILGYSSFKVLNFNLQQKIISSSIYGILLVNLISLSINNNTTLVNPYGYLTMVAEDKQTIYNNLNNVFESKVAEDGQTIYNNNLNNVFESKIKEDQKNIVNSDFKDMPFKKKLLFKIKYLLLIHKIEKAILESINTMGNIEMTKLLLIFQDNKEAIMEFFFYNQIENHHNYNFKYGSGAYEDLQYNNTCIHINGQQYPVQLLKRENGKFPANLEQESLISKRDQSTQCRDNFLSIFGMTREQFECNHLSSKEKV